MSISNIFNPIRSRIRRYFRQRMMPVSVDEAMEKREFYAKLYFLTTFSLFAYLLYGLYQKKVQTTDKSVPLAEATIEKLKIDGKIRILKFEGFKKVDDYFYERKGDNKAVNPDVELLVETPSAGESETTLWKRHMDKIKYRTIFLQSVETRTQPYAADAEPDAQITVSQDEVPESYEQNIDKTKIVEPNMKESRPKRNNPYRT